VVLAVPVAPPGSVERLCDCADEVVCLETPEFFLAVGQFYSDFSQITDTAVVDYLERAAEGMSATSASTRTASSRS